MTTEITFRRGPNDPTSGSGLTLAEPAFNTTLHTFHIGLGYGVTAEWVGGPISGLSADIAAGITYKIPTLAAVKNYIGGLCYGNTGAATITQYVSSFNGLTGAVGGVCAAQENTFVPIQSFTNGISAAGGTFSALTRFTAGISASGGITFNSDVTIDSSNTLNVGTITSPDTLNIDKRADAFIFIGDVDNDGNGTSIFLRDGTGVIDILSPNGVITIGEVEIDTPNSSVDFGSFPIRIPKLPRLTSAVFESKTTNWTPTDADDGKIFVVNISGKSTITCTLNGLSVGVSFKIFVQSGTVAFSVTGTGHGSALTLGSISTASSTTIYCTASNVYFGTSSG